MAVGSGKNLLRMTRQAASVCCIGLKSLTTDEFNFLENLRFLESSHVVHKADATPDRDRDRDREPVAASEMPGLALLPRLPGTLETRPESAGGGVSGEKSSSSRRRRGPRIARGCPRGSIGAKSSAAGGTWSLPASAGAGFDGGDGSGRRGRGGVRRGLWPSALLGSWANRVLLPLDGSQGGGVDPGAGKPAGRRSRLKPRSGASVQVCRWLGVQMCSGLGCRYGEP